MDYKDTMNLPRTDFPMKANLSKREPEWTEHWKKIDVYRRSLEVNGEDAPVFILHDGPPYANGDIHMGTAFNKVFKDLVVKYKTQRGYLSPYVPGWDCHGQPIEHQVEKNLGPEKMTEITQTDLRGLCREYAMKFVARQAEEFERLGVRGDFGDPYLTLAPAYEAGNVRVFAEMYRRGMIYRGRKPIHWCYRCRTALAEAEIEYWDEESDSIYVGFRFLEKPDAWKDSPQDVYVLIWTTTPWTLPANVAVTLAEDADYVGVKAGDKVLVMAEALAEAVMETAGVEGYEVLPGRAKGSELSGLEYEQPIHEDMRGVIITGEHVELSTGTGAVHTAPGHGEEDYLMGIRFDLPMPMPVQDDGTFDAGGGPFAGMFVEEANPAVIDWLRERGTLLHAGKTTHSYPHCWRCKKPVIFRATEQWFVSMDATGLRDQALEAVKGVEWVPGWSVNRISAMVGDRPDWCISRQRAWGVPIPVFHCVRCNEVVANDETFAATEKLFAEEGSDAWFTRKPEEYLPEGTACGSCGCSELKSETDIVDVWFESGVSHTSVLKTRQELRFPAELYLEGSDQHRGWFQSALLTSVGAYGVAPYRAVLTHGFIVDGEGRKMSKSLGNVIDPLKVVEQYGADIIRLWAASSDYSQDVSVSDEILDRTSEAYRRIRNTFRFLLGNVHDYDPSMAIDWTEMPEVDRYALARLGQVLDEVTKHYDEWRYHMVFRTLYGYCVTDLSAFYMDVLKDRLYSDATGSTSRRSAQTVLARILVSLVRMVAPILTFTAEEVWNFMPEGMRDADSVQLSGWPHVHVPEGEAKVLLGAYSTILAVRDEVLKALEDARNAKLLTKSQEASVTVYVADEYDRAVLQTRPFLADLLMTSQASVLPYSGAPEDARRGDVEGIAVSIRRAEGEKCARCWNYRTEVGSDAEHPEVCARCLAVLRGTKE